MEKNSSFEKDYIFNNSDFVVPFDIASLLKTHGFDIECRLFYIYERLEEDDIYRQYEDADFFVEAPTICFAILWIYSKYNTWIAVNREEDVFNFTITIYRESSYIVQKSDITFDTPTKAYYEGINTLFRTLNAFKL